MTGAHHPRVQTLRDLIVLGDGDGGLVVACDSIGGIGPKPADTVSTSAAIVGHFAARVPLLEVMCAGAEPVVIVNTLCVEQDPTGREMIGAIREIAEQAGVVPEAVTGSTEENVITQATGIGITVIGRLGPDGLRAGNARPGDVVLCAGFPRSAPHDEVYPGHPDQVAISDVRAVLGSGLVHDALPVGSKGLAWEVPQLAASAGLAVRWRADQPIPIDRSAGPSSCVLLACDPADEDAVRSHFPGRLPVHAVADLVPGDDDHR